jgi:hypothetical protein
MIRTTASPVFQTSKPQIPRLSDDLLARCAARPPGYDHEHRFCTEVFAASRGAIFAAGHAESGNDIPVLLSTTLAERRLSAASC